MTANVHTEAKVPCIAQSESFGPCRGTRRPRPADARKVNSCLSRRITQVPATMRLAAPANGLRSSF